MIAALAAFVCTLATAFIDGYGSMWFVPVLIADAARSAWPLLLVAVAAALARRCPPVRRSRRLVGAVSAMLTGTVALACFGWWWVEPHALLDSVTGSSSQARWWLAATGALAGLALTAAASYCRRPALLTELALAGIVTFLLGGGRVYRAFDQVEAGRRAVAAALIAVTCVAIVLVAYRLMRDRSAAQVGALGAVSVCAALVLALVFGDRASGALPAAAPSGSAESVLLVVVDTLRADVADRDDAGVARLMPQLDRIAAGGTRFTQAVAPAPWTLPSTVSILSGWNPHRHKAGQSSPDWQVPPGDPAASYLGPLLRDSGYEVAAFVHNPYLRPYYGFGRGHLLFRPYHGRAADGANLLLDWLGGHGQRPFFAMLHIMDPHWPYEAPAGFGLPRNACETCDSLFALKFSPTPPEVHVEVRNRYEAEVSYVDFVLGGLYDTLLGRGLLDHTWLIVTADHGEEFWEHGSFLHGHDLYDELLRVPLLVIPPRSRSDVARGRRVTQQVRLEDVAASMLDITGLNQSAAPDGKSLLPLLAEAVPTPEDAAARAVIAGYIKSPIDLRYAVRQPPLEGVFGQPGGAGPVLFDLSNDPGQQSGAALARLSSPFRAPVAARLEQLEAIPGRVGIDVQRRPLLSSPGSGPDADTAQQLRSLGYLQ